MILLQAAIGYGMVFVVILIISLLVDTPFFAGLYADTYSKIKGVPVKKNIFDKKLSEGEREIIASCYWLAAITVVVLFVLLCFLFNNTYPNFLEYS